MVRGIDTDKRVSPRSVDEATGATVAMDKHLVGGILWTAAAKWSSQLFTWGALIIVARFLAPADLGVVGMAAVYLGTARIVSEFGFGSAVITLRDLKVDEIAQINSFAVLLGIAGAALTCAVAWPLGAFFHSPPLPMVLVVMSTTILAAGIQTVPFSLLQRELRFKYLSVGQSATALAQAVCTLVLAILGWGYWAMVAGNVLGAVTFAGLIATRRPGGFKWPRFASVKHALTFSWQVLVAQLSWNFYTDADFLVAGRVLGANPLGAYTLGWNLATVPVEKITTLVGQVTPAVFSASQTDLASLRRYVLGLTEGLSVITFPMAMGLMITAPDLVPVVFGKSWLATVAPLQALAFFASARSISALLGPLLIVLRETRFIMWTNVAAAVLMPTAFYVGSHWGPAGIAWGWVVAYPVIMLCLYRRAFRKVGMPRGAYLRILLPALTGTVAMLAGVWLLNRFLAAAWAPPLRLGADIVVGAAIYCAILALLYPDRIRALINLYRGLRATSAAAV